MINLKTLKTPTEFTDKMLTALAALVVLMGFIALFVVPAIAAITT